MLLTALLNIIKKQWVGKLKGNNAISALIAAAIKRNDKKYLAELKQATGKQIKVSVTNGKQPNS